MPMYQGSYIMIKNSASSVALVFSILCCFPLHAFAEGSIHGQIRNATTGQPIGFATVEASNCNTIEAMEDGAYIIDCPAGSYALNVGASGFQPYSSDVFYLNDDDFIKMNVKLIPQQPIQQNQARSNNDENYYQGEQNQAQNNYEEPEQKNNFSKSSSLLGALLGSVASGRVDKRLQNRKMRKQQRTQDLENGSCETDEQGFCLEIASNNANNGDCTIFDDVNGDCIELPPGKLFTCIDFDHINYKCNEPSANNCKYVDDGTSCVYLPPYWYYSDCQFIDFEYNCFTEDPEQIETERDQPRDTPVKAFDGPVSSSGITPGSLRPQGPGHSSPPAKNNPLAGISPKTGIKRPTSTSTSNPLINKKPGAGNKLPPLTSTSKNNLLPGNKQTSQQASSSGTVIKKPALTRVTNKNSSITLKAGKPAVKFTLYGQSLNKITNVAAIDPKGKIDKNISIKLDRNRDNKKLPLYINAASNAVTNKGYYRLLVLMGKKHFIVNKNNVAIIVNKLRPTLSRQTISNTPISNPVSPRVLRK